MNNKLQDPSMLNIKSIDSKPKENVGSLLKLFSSEYFTLDMAISYLYKKRNEEGVFNFLVNKLYNYSDYEISFYIPQLCYSLIKTHSAALEKFMLDKCVKNITLFLKILWCIKSYGQAERRNKKNYDYVETLTQKAEMAMVNATTMNKVLYDPFGMPISGKHPGEIAPEELDAIVAEAERKSNRVEYLSETLRFINILVSISLRLKEQKIEDRKMILKSYVHRINRWLLNMRKKHAKDRDEYFRRLFFGIQLPFFSPTEDSSTQIVRILEDELTCFNTKKRAPYRIVVETIDMGELETIKSHRNSDSSEHSGHAGINHTITHEEDNFDDLISEQIGDEYVPSPTLPSVQTLNMKDKYEALKDFGKIAKQEEAKWKDTQILKGVDLVQKFDLMKHKTDKTSTVPTNVNAEGFESLQMKRKPTIDLKEETKDVEILHKMHTENIQRFNNVFPRQPVIKRRKSFNCRFDGDGRRGRARSLQRLRDSDLLKAMEDFKEHSLPRNLLPRYTKVLDDLKNLEFEHPHSKQLKLLETASTMPQNEVTGWGPWEELWEYKQKAIQEKSPFGHLKSYKLRCLVVKANDDLRQELIVMQIINKIQSIWKAAGLPLALKSYDILVTSNDSGILEFVIDTLSLDGIKKNNPGKSLLQFFKETYGYDFEEARKNFMDSLAAYCIICYLLQIKDRHNGNILLDAHGYLVHIDFGFILSTSPGNINFESAPFKLTSEYVELMDGYGSTTFTYFRMQLVRGFMELRGHVESLTTIIRVMMEGSDLPCFEVFDINTFADRFKERSTDKEMIDYVERLVESSFDNWRTIQYDNFQKYTNGILP